jgi:hypothetical protein
VASNEDSDYLQSIKWNGDRCAPLPICIAGQYNKGWGMVTSGRCLNCPTGYYKLKEHSKTRRMTTCGAFDRCKQHPTPEETGSKHEVRCCSDKKHKKYVKRGDCQKKLGRPVWAESYDINKERCIHAATWNEANRHCKKDGARLCTQEELSANCAKGSGCGHDSDMIWTSSRAPGGSHDDQCTPCSAGCGAGAANPTCGLGNAGRCKSCPAGRYQDNPHSFVLKCTVCPGGKFQPKKGQTSCQSCAAGKASTSDAVLCTNCKAGTHAKAGANVCANCPAGTFSAAKAGSCIGCAKGHYSDAGDPSCDACVPGTYGSGSQDAQYCKVCSPGKWQTQDAQTSCLFCPAGKFGKGDDETRDGCTACAAGTFQNLYGQDECVKCPNGTYTASTESTVCNKCAKCDQEGFARLTCGGTKSGKCTKCPALPTIHGKPQWTFPTATWKCGTEFSCPAGEYTPESEMREKSVHRYAHDYHERRECGGDNIRPGQNIAFAEAINENDGVFNGAFKKYQGPFLERGVRATRGDCVKWCEVSPGCKAWTYSKKNNYCFLMDQRHTTTDVLDRAAKLRPSKTNPADSGVCKLAGGKYSIHCVDCPTGYFKHAAGTEKCQACSTCGPGHSNVECGLEKGHHQETCKPCGYGTFKPLTGFWDTGCMPCNPGTFSDILGAHKCKKCTPGRYQSGQGEWDCNKCPAGRFSNSYASGECSQCAPGYYAPVGSTSCTKCADGFSTPKTSTQASADQCAKCPAGTFEDGACKACAVGKSSSEGQTTCTACAAGTFAVEKGSATCKSCSAHKPDVTSTHCLTCPAGKFQKADGVDECVSCPSGYFSKHPDTNSACHSCDSWEPNNKAKKFWTKNLAGQHECVVKRIDCTYVGDWSDWSTCGVTCGGKDTTRTRRRTARTGPKFGGAKCETKQTEPCGTVDCPVDCNMGKWTSWSECSVPCGIGKETRTRKLIGLNMYGGSACGAMTQDRKCDMGACVCNHVSCKLEYSPTSGELAIRVEHANNYDYARKHHCYFNHISDSCECDCPYNQDQINLALEEHRTEMTVYGRNARPDHTPSVRPKAVFRKWRKTFHNGTLLADAQL